MKALEHASFPEISQRISGLYNEEDDALLVGMLGQDYIIRRNGIFLHGQNAPENHASVLYDYIFSSGSELSMTPWRPLVDFADRPMPDFRKKVETPIIQYVPDIVGRANAILPMFDARQSTSLVGSDLAVTVRALPKVYLHMELSQETQDFPAEAWILFSNNANEFLTVESMFLLAEIFKDRLLSLIRIY